MDLSEDKNHKRINPETFTGSEEQVKEIKDEAAEMRKSAININHDNPTIEERVVDKKRDAVLNLIGDVQTQRQDIDKLTQQFGLITQDIHNIANAIQQQNQIINTLSKGGAPQADSKNQLSDLLNSDLGIKLMDKLLPTNAPVETPLISQEDIKKEMVSSYLDNLNTGKAINNFVKDALKKKVVKTVVTDTMQSLGSAEHEPA